MPQPSDVPGSSQSAIDSFASLLAVMKRLRGPDGCPWDKEQSHESIRTFLLEEAYEALEAIDRKEWGLLKEELGDLLFQIIFHAQIAEEAHRFDIGNVIAGLNEKLVKRHPHVFGDARVKDANEQTLHWDRLKSKEKGGSLLDRVPKIMPALLQAFELQERAHRLGFTWNHLSEVWEKLKEEMQELEEARSLGNHAAIEEEAGDVLFVLANLCRWLKVNPEEALMKANQKFRVRFAGVETHAAAMNRTLSDLTPEELEELWQKVKQEER